MYIAEIRYPGTWLDLEDRDVAFEIEGMLRNMVDLVSEAAIALTFFENSLGVRYNPKSEWKQDAAIRHEIDEKLKEELGDAYYQDYDNTRLESDRWVRRRKMELGIVPRAYVHKIPFIHAHSFVFAVDSLGKFLDELTKYEQVPAEIVTHQEKFNELLPSVRKIRNSAQHIEDRSRGFGSWKDKRDGKKMKVNGFLGLSNLEGNQLCYTIDDGSYQKIEISASTFKVIVEIMNNLLQSFKWKGPASIEPHY